MLSSQPPHQAVSLHIILSSDLHLSQKKRRLSALAERIQGLSSDYLNQQDFNLVLDQVVAARLFEVTKQKDLRITPEEHKAGLTARPWDDPELRLKHLMVKMRALVSNTSWRQLRVDAELQGILTPEYLLKDMKRLAVQYTVEQLNIRQFTIDAEVTPETNPEAEPPLIHCTSVDLEAAMICAIDVWRRECKAQHVYMPKKFRWKLTLDGRPLGGHDQVAVGMVPLIHGLKLQSADSVYPLLLFNGRESKHNLHQALKDLAAQMAEVKLKGLTIGGVVYEISYLLCCDMSSLWKIFIDTVTGDVKKFGLDFCVFCHVSKDGRWDLDNPDFQKMRGDITCIFPVALTEIVFCSLHCRMRIVDKLMSQLAVTAHQNNSQKGVQALIVAVREAGVKSFNIDQKTLAPTALIGGNCTKILLSRATIVASAEKANSHELTQSLEVWESVYTIDQAMRANHEKAKAFLDGGGAVHITELCSALSFAYQNRYASTSPDPNNAGLFEVGLEATDVCFYLHYVVAHLPALLLRFVEQGLSVGDRSQEGFENSHKHHRLIYAKATARDGGRQSNLPGATTSMTQMLSHQYTLLLRRAGRLTYSDIRPVQLVLE